jgi:apolipoprotein N-acyltransferase
LRLYVARVKTQTALLLAALSGVLYFLGFIGFDQWYLEWIALVPLLVVLDGIQSGRRAFFISWFMGWVTHLGGYYWLVHLLMTFGELPLPLAVLGYLLICLVQSGQLALFGWLAWKLRQGSGLGIGWCAPIALVAAEFAYPLMLFDTYLANSQAWQPVLIQVSDLGGTLVLSAVIGVVNGAIAQLILARRRQAPWPRPLVLSAAAALLFTVAYGVLRIDQIEARDAASEKLKVAMIQGNIGGAEKHLRGPAGITRYREMTDAVVQTPGLGVVVWPEGAFDDFVGPDANLTGLVASEVKTPMIIGAVRIDTPPALRSPQTKYWNSLLALEPGGRVIAHYDKVKLLLFGETLPGYETFPGFYRWLLEIGILPYVSVFSAGSTLEPLPLGQYRISADVCYEDILPRHIRALMRPIDASGTRPHAMFNGTNDSWYGPVEPRIHLALSVFRAVEHRRWLIRSTVTGISAFIDSNGRIVRRSGFETAETLIQDVPMVVAGATLYGIIGDALGWLALASVVGLIVRGRAKRAQT